MPTVLGTAMDGFTVVDSPLSPPQDYTTPYLGRSMDCM
jgi:hypothetical protein